MPGNTPISKIENNLLYQVSHEQGELREVLLLLHRYVGNHSLASPHPFVGGAPENVEDPVTDFHLG